MWFQCHLELPAPSRSEPRLCCIVGSREPRGLNRLSMKNGVWFIIPKHCTVTLINIWGFNLVCRYSSTWDDVCVATTSSLLPYCGWYLGMVNPLQCGSVAVCVAADPGCSGVSPCCEPTITYPSRHLRGKSERTVWSKNLVLARYRSFWSIDFQNCN